MDLRYEKAMRIASDVMGYCNMLGADELGLELSLQPHVTRLTVRAQVAQLEPKALATVDRYLNIPRQREVEQNYWNMCGEEEIDSELGLAGMMVDSAAVAYEGGVLTIAMERLETSL